ncbi:MAG TPA: hypothetical protein EYG03_16500 [Planctomycetes bacterium]|nr:hypothetical protein [Planctomycetota bacterium]
MTNYIGPTPCDAQKDIRTERLSGTASGPGQGITVIAGVRRRLLRRDEIRFAAEWSAAAGSEFEVTG